MWVSRALIPGTSSAHGVRCSAITALRSNGIGVKATSRWKRSGSCGLAQQLHRRAVDAAAVVLDLVVGNRDNVDAATLQRRDRLRAVVGDHASPGRERQAVDRPPLLGFDPDRL